MAGEMELSRREQVMIKRIAIMVLVAAGLLGIAPGSLAEDDLPKWHKQLEVVTDDSKQWGIQWHEMDIDSRVDWVDRSDTRHELELEGTIRRAENIDAVCVSKRLRVDGALDANGTDIYIRQERRRSGHRSGSYAAFRNGLANIEVHKAELRKNAYAIEKLGVSAKVMLAKERTSARLPAIVMEKYTKVHDDVLLRISGLKIDEKRILKLTTRSRKKFDGLKGAFDESVYALDSEGKRMGGGRWVRGDPFGDECKITYQFAVEKGRTHAAFEFILCTKFEMKVYSFTSKGIFQKAR
jgi:hypothetical protein